MPQNDPFPIITPDRGETPFEGGLLSLSKHVTTQAAGVALRSWWSNTPATMRAREGVVIPRAWIAARNNDGGTPIPTLLLGRHDADGRETLLAAFSDASAVVLRASGVTAPEHASLGDMFEVLPAVLRLASIARPKDGRPAARIRMRSGTRRSTTMITLERETAPDGWINLEAADRAHVDEIDPQTAAEIRETLLREAAAWALQLDGLPCQVDPVDGRPNLHIDTARARPAFSPAFLPWAAYTTEEAELFAEFLKDVCVWMFERLGPGIAAVDARVQARQPGQKANAARPKMRIQVLRYDRNAERQKATSEALSGELESIIRAGLAPIPLERLEGQVLGDFRSRRTWLDPATLGNVFADRERLKGLSAHQRLAHHQRFGRFATEIA